MLLIISTHFRCNSTGFLAGKLIHTNARTNFQSNRTFTQYYVVLWHNFVSPVYKQWQYVNSKLLSKQECSVAESPNLTVGSTCAFGEYHYRISTFHQILEFRKILVETIAYGIKFCIPDNQAVKRVFPHPVVCEHHNLRRQHKQAHQIEMRLVVCNYNGGLVKCLVLRILYGVFHPRQIMYCKTVEPAYNIVVMQTFLFAIATYQPIYQRIRCN